MRVHVLTGGAPSRTRPATSADRRTRRRATPTLLAAALALGYVAVAPRSLDLAAQLFRVRLFGAEGFGLWDNWWYAGHDVLGYSVLFPALGWLTSPQLVGALAAVAAAAAFEALAFERFGDDALVGSLWFGAATLTPLLSGRLTFALGLAGALGAALALQRGRSGWALLAGLATALASPVAALFAALAGAAYAAGDLRDRRRAALGGGVILTALGPVAALAIAFPEGGHEPFALSAFLPIPVLAVGLLLAVPARERALRAGIALYGLGCVAAFVIPTPVGGNAARLGVLVAGPLFALLWHPRRRRALLVLAVPLLYVQWHDGVSDLRSVAGDPATTAAYYRPLLGFLSGRPGPFRIEIPFTANHWEAYEVAPQVPLARGWERQLDIADNGLFYGGRLTAARYERWLHRLAVGYVALPDARLDRSAVAEARLIRRGPAFLRLVFRSRHWRVYAVSGATALGSGAATVTALGPSSVSLLARRAGRTLVRVRYSPYWRLAGASGCVAPAGAFTEVTVRRPGPAGRAGLVIAFAPDRIAARSPRCS